MIFSHLSSFLSLFWKIFLSNTGIVRSEMRERMYKYIVYFFSSMRLVKLPPCTDRLLDYDVKMQLLESGAFHPSWLSIQKEPFYHEYQLGLQIICSLSISRWISSIIFRDKHLGLQLVDSSFLFGDEWQFIEVIMLILYPPKLIERYLPRCDKKSTKWLTYYFKPISVERQFCERWLVIRKLVNLVFLLNWVTYYVIILVLNLVIVDIRPMFFLSSDHSRYMASFFLAIAMICTTTTLRRYFCNIFLFQSYAILAMFHLEKSLHDFQFLNSIKNPGPDQIIPLMRRYLSTVEEINGANRIISVYGGSTYMTGFFASAFCFFVTFMMNTSYITGVVFGFIMAAGLFEGIVMTAMVPWICLKSVSMRMVKILLNNK